LHDKFAVLNPNSSVPIHLSPKKNDSPFYRTSAPPLSAIGVSDGHELTVINGHPEATIFFSPLGATRHQGWPFVPVYEASVTLCLFRVAGLFVAIFSLFLCLLPFHPQYVLPQELL
jgi:hypothetical protein